VTHRLATRCVKPMELITNWKYCCFFPSKTM